SRRWRGASTRDKRLAHAVTNREGLQAAHEIRLDERGGAGELDRLDAGEELAKDRFDLHFCEHAAETEVGAEAEREVRVGIAIDAEAKWIGEYLLVAVARRVAQHQALAGADLLAADD